MTFEAQAHPRKPQACAQTEPVVRQVKAVLHQGSIGRSSAKGLGIFFLVTGAYLLSLVGICLLPWLAAKASLSLIAGGLIATLFVAAHDACHGALTPRAWLNRILGRLLFLPTCHPYAAWEHSHNGLHHGYTNIRELDPVFPPLDKSEYDALSQTQRLWERLMRSPCGVIMLYLWKVWIPFEAIPGKRAGLKRASKRWFQFDRACCLTFLCLQITSGWLIARATGQPPTTIIGLGVVVPTFVFFYLIAWAVHLHHTHPSVPWYATRAEWTYFRGQVRCSVHMDLPRPVELFILNIMDHTAHHADPKIPLYGLHEAQKRMEAAYPTEIVHEPFSINGWLRTFRICRLYDYQTHRWLDWDGTPLTNSLVTRFDPSTPSARRGEFARMQIVAPPKGNLDVVEQA